MKIKLLLGLLMLCSALLGCSKEEEDDLPSNCGCQTIIKYERTFEIDFCGPNGESLEELELPPDFVEQFIELSSEKELEIFQTNSGCD